VNEARRFDHVFIVSDEWSFGQEYKYSISVRDAPVGEDSTSSTGSTGSFTLATLSSKLIGDDGLAVRGGEFGFVHTIIIAHLG
jgi:hypothetical protein